MTVPSSTPAPHGQRNIVLTGFMGTGKTTVGRLLATELGYDFVDTDAIIEANHGPISLIFAEQGEAAFRAIEQAVAAELADRSKLVIATGGRMMLDPANVASLSRKGRVFCLVATTEEILGRVTSDGARIERPLLAVADPHQRIIELLAERTPQYRRFAQLSTSGRSPEAIAGDLATLARSDAKHFTVDTPAGDYEYTVGAALLPFVRELVGVHGPLVIVTNHETAQLFLASCSTPDLVITLPSPLPSGSERSKILEAVQYVGDQLLVADIDHTATIMSLGGSIVGDVASFAAATYRHGLDLVHCPTDLIAMIDTSVGGTVGFDATQERNLGGLYQQPKAVVADVATLQTLDARQVAAGMAEVITYGLVAGSRLIEAIEAGTWHEAGLGLPGALGELESLVVQAVQIKIAILQEGPSEVDRREVLNLGHTIGHALEAVDPEGLHRGEAVGLGLIATARLSRLLGHCGPELPQLVEHLVEHVGLPTQLPNRLDVDLVAEAMQRDEKRLDRPQRFVLLRDVGNPFVTSEVSHGAIVNVLDTLQP